MSKYNTTYYLLILLLITGAFAAMAQNGYGLRLMGLVAVVFGLVFMIQGIQVVQKKGLQDPVSVLELFGLTILSALFALRIFYIHFLYVEYIFAATGLILIGVYLYKMVMAYRVLRTQNAYFSGMVVLFYGSISLFIVSMITVPFVPQFSEPAGMIAFALVVLFSLISLYKKQVLLNGEKVSAFRLATRSENRTVVLISVFVLFSLYIGLTKISLIPNIYSDEFPQAYFELVNRAETGQESLVDGKFDHDRFMEEYEKVVRRHTGTINR